MKRRLELFYESFGDRGIMFILYVFSVVVNSLLTWNMVLPTVYPDEIVVAGEAALFSGTAKWPVLTGISSSGYLQGLLYVPLYRLFNNQFALYKTMLVVNALLISFIPMIIYHLASKLGVARVHQKIIIAISCGMYISYIADSKYIWNETAAALICWLIILSFFNTWDKSSRGSVILGSIMPGILCALGYAACPRLLAIAAALILTVFIAQFVFHERIVNILLFVISFVLAFLGEYLIRDMLNGRIKLAGFSPSYTSGFWSKIFSHLYAFTTTTLGMGALAAALTAVMLLKLIREGTRRKGETPESNTKVYEPIKHTYSMRLTLFALFQLLAVLLTAVYSALDGSGSGTARLTDDLAPLALFLVMVFIYLYGIDLKQTLIGIGIYGYLCICFAIDGEPLNPISGSLSGMLPFVFPAEGDSADKMNYIMMSSCVFTMLALIVVYTSCSRRHRTLLVSVSVFAVIVFSTAYLGGYWLPNEAKAAEEELETFRKVSDMLYNDPLSPPIIVYETDPRLAGTIQFLAPQTRVTIMEKGGKAPEECLLIAENGSEVPFERGSYENVGRTDKYTVYAFGESARNFMRYSSSKT